jgi:hypothetical protein
MKTIYSLLYVNLNAALEERVCIGLVMSNRKEYFYEYSAKKLKYVSQLLSEEKKSFIKRYLKSLEQDLTQYKGLNYQLFEKKTYVENWVREEYLTYLSTYANNIVSFSAPQTIDLPCTSENFKRLFEKYVFEYEAELMVTSPLAIKIQEEVKHKLYTQIEDRVNLDITLDQSDFYTLLVPSITVDFIGKNELAVLGQTIDFNKSINHIQHDLTSYLSLTMSVEEQEKRKGVYFVVGKEPDKQNKTHEFWSNIRTSPFVEYVELDELERISQYMEDHNVQPYFEF